jgi:hypothetical protein
MLYVINTFLVSYGLLLFKRDTIPNVTIETNSNGKNIFAKIVDILISTGLIPRSLLRLVE